LDPPPRGGRCSGHRRGSRWHRCPQCGQRKQGVPLGLGDTPCGTPGRWTTSPRSFTSTNLDCPPASALSEQAHPAGGCARQARQPKVLPGRPQVPGGDGPWDQPTTTVATLCSTSHATAPLARLVLRLAHPSAVTGPRLSSVLPGSGRQRRLPFWPLPGALCCRLQRPALWCPPGAGAPPPGSHVPRRGDPRRRPSTAYGWMMPRSMPCDPQRSQSGKPLQRLQLSRREKSRPASATRGDRADRIGGVGGPPCRRRNPQLGGTPGHTEPDPESPRCGKHPHRKRTGTRPLLAPGKTCPLPRRSGGEPPRRRRWSSASGHPRCRFRDQLAEARPPSAPGTGRRSWPPGGQCHSRELVVALDHPCPHIAGGAVRALCRTRLFIALTVRGIKPRGISRTVIEEPAPVGPQSR